MSISLERIKEILKPRQYKNFIKWVGGQTGELINGQLFIYEEDFIRWIRRLPVID